jgi:nucleotide-binding universal stress UspA family protein
MYRRIVVALDGSRFAETIIPYAAWMAESMGIRLAVVRVARQEQTFQAKTYVDDIALKVDAEGAVVTADAEPKKALLDALREGPGGLVAMTTHGRSGLMESLLGSMASTIVSNVPGPVLLLRPQQEAIDLTDRRPISTVLVTLDGNEHSERVLPHAASLAKSLGVDLKLIQVISQHVALEPALKGDVLESSYVHARAMRVRDQYGLEPDWEVLHGDPARAICDHVGDVDDGMLAMATHARKGLAKTVLGSVTAGCVRRCGVPVLVLGANC